jgi:hypothetical protein
LFLHRGRVDKDRRAELSDKQSARAADQIADNLFSQGFVTRLLSGQHDPAA